MKFVYNGKFIEKWFANYLRLSEDILIYRCIDFYQSNQKNLLTQSLHCDFFGCYQGKYFTLELKETYNQNSFDFYQINQQQKNTLLQTSMHQGIGLVGVYFHFSNLLFIVPWKEILNIKLSGKVSFESFQNYCQGFNINRNIKEFEDFFKKLLI